MMEWWDPVIWETSAARGAATIANRTVAGEARPVGRADQGHPRRRSSTTTATSCRPARSATSTYAARPRSVRRRAEQTASHGEAFTIGDVGLLDDDGYLFIRDRAKDMIITGGVNVTPKRWRRYCSRIPRSSTSP